MQLQSIAAFGEKGTGFRPRKTGVPRAAPTLLSRFGSIFHDQTMQLRSYLPVLLCLMHAICILSRLIERRVEQLRLLSKAEQAGLLSLAERNGLTLSFIERSGLLSKAESLGLLSAATDR